MRKLQCVFVLVNLLAISIGLGSPLKAEGRRVVSLDGTWQIAEGSMDRMPSQFGHHVPVPGLVDMTQPAFTDVGNEKESGKHRQAFWYRRTFEVDGPIPAVATLKIHKAKYGIKVFLNGRLVGEHLPCFTPALLDVTDHLQGDGQTNELVVRVGATRGALPKSYPRGWDFEKDRYIPGIYDSVELILSGTPHIVRVQTVPDLEKQTVRVVAVLANAGEQIDARLKCRVREASTGKVVGTAEAKPVVLSAGQEESVEVEIPIADCRLWSPEDPFLYWLEATTGTDTLPVRFGMRSFRFDPQTKQALLNGKPYPLRGTNVCIFRFFEDSVRKDLPWREDWVRRLHRVFRDMHWNSARYCIGFPPEKWYDIADEEGLLIQDEFPIWYMQEWPEELKSEQLVKEYTAWMQERWNHPCVVIWDAQNETYTEETGKAIQAVRGLDLSNRPWENGWAAPQSPTDCVESHPYLFIRDWAGGPPFRMSEMSSLSPVPLLQPPQKKLAVPIIVNEYAWLWLNRKGEPTTVTREVYRNQLGESSTAGQRRELWAKYLAAQTEFWRAHRQCAGVLHFCSLCFSRRGDIPQPKGGATSDHWLDVARLQWEPHFEHYVRDAFAPTGLMLDFWAEDLVAAEARTIPVVVVNDRQTPWQGTVTLRILQGANTIVEHSQSCQVDSVGRAEVTFEIVTPDKPGEYQMVAELVATGQEPVRSWRDFVVLTAEQKEARDGIALGKPVTASSSINDDRGNFAAEFAVDGKRHTRWSSEFSDPQWIAVDLGKPQKISRVELTWQGAYGKGYTIQISKDGKAWTDVFTTDNGDGKVDEIRFDPIDARWIRLNGTKRDHAWGYSLFEMKVFR